MEILVHPSTTPRGFGLGNNERDELIILSGCCVTELVAIGGGGDRACCSCRKTVMKGEDIVNSGIFWRDWKDGLSVYNVTTMEEWLSAWFGYPLSELKVSIG